MTDHQEDEQFIELTQDIFAMFDTYMPTIFDKLQQNSKHTKASASLMMFAIEQALVMHAAKIAIIRKQKLQPDAKITPATFAKQAKYILEGMERMSLSSKEI